MGRGRAVSLYIGVAGASRPASGLLEQAEVLGRRLAEAGAVVVCGGGPGVMEAVCRGARSAGGTTVGLLPGLDRRDGNPYLSVAVPTGMGQGRNLLLVRSSDAMVAIGGGFGTLSEIALALRTGVPVVGLARPTRPAGNRTPERPTLRPVPSCPGGGPAVPGDPT